MPPPPRDMPPRLLDERVLAPLLRLEPPKALEDEERMLDRFELPPMSRLRP